MTLSTLIKISSINNLSDARYNAGMGAGILGFCPEPGHSDFVDLKKFKEITGWIKGVKLAGEFYRSSASDILNLAESYQFDLIQFENAEMVDQVSAIGKPLIFRFYLPDIQLPGDIPEIMKKLMGKVKYYLIEGELRNNDIIKNFCDLSRQFPVILGTGIDSSNILALLNECSFSGFAFKSGHEIKPGYFDPGILARIFELLDNDN